MNKTQYNTQDEGDVRDKSGIRGEEEEKRGGAFEREDTQEKQNSTKKTRTACGTERDGLDSLSTCGCWK